MQLEAASERFEGGVRRAEDEDPPWFGEARQGDCEWSSQAQEGFPQSLDECQVTQAETTLAQLRDDGQGRRVTFESIAESLTV